MVSSMITFIQDTVLISMTITSKSLISSRINSRPYSSQRLFNQQFQSLNASDLPSWKLFIKPASNVPCNGTKISCLISLSTVAARKGCLTVSTARLAVHKSPDNLDRHKNFFSQILFIGVTFLFIKEIQILHPSVGRKTKERTNPCLMSSAILGDKNKLNGRCKNAFTFNIISPGIIYESLRPSISHLFLIKYRLMNSTWHLVIQTLALINGKFLFAKIGNAFAFSTPKTIDESWKIKKPNRIFITCTFIMFSL